MTMTSSLITLGLTFFVAWLIWLQVKPATKNMPQLQASLEETPPSLGEVREEELKSGFDLALNAELIEEPETQTVEETDAKIFADTSEDLDLQLFNMITGSANTEADADSRAETLLDPYLIKYRLSAFNQISGQAETEIFPNLDIWSKFKLSEQLALPIAWSHALASKETGMLILLGQTPFPATPPATPKGGDSSRNDTAPEFNISLKEQAQGDTPSREMNTESNEINTEEITLLLLVIRSYQLNTSPDPVVMHSAGLNVTVESYDDTLILYRPVPEHSQAELLTLLDESLVVFEGMAEPQEAQMLNQWLQQWKITG